MRHPNRMNGGEPILGTCARKKRARNQRFRVLYGIGVQKWRRMRREERKALIRHGRSKQP